MITLRSMTGEIVTTGNSTETRILSRLSARLSKGRADYGPLDVHDGRDWLEEAIQEAADLLIYLECLKEQRDGGSK